MKVYSLESDQTITVVEGASGMADTEASEFVETMYACIDSGKSRVIFDCTGPDYLTSLMLGVLAQLNSRLKMKGGELKICTAKKMILDLFKLTNMDKVFEIHPDLDTAVRAFKAD